MRIAKQDEEESHDNSVNAFADGIPPACPFGASPFGMTGLGSDK